MTDHPTKLLPRDKPIKTWFTSHYPPEIITFFLTHPESHTLTLAILYLPHQS